MVFAIGSLRPSAWTRSGHASPPTSCWCRCRRGGHVPLVAVTTHAGGADLDRPGRRRLHPRTRPLQGSATTASLPADSREEQDWLRQELEHASESLKADAAESGPHLADLWRQVTVERQILEAEQNFPRTEHRRL